MADIAVGTDLSGAKVSFFLNDTDLAELPSGQNIIFKSDNTHYLYFMNHDSAMHAGVQLVDGDKVIEIADYNKGNRKLTLINPKIQLSESFGVLTEVNDEIELIERISLNHNIVYGYCESLCKVEVLSKEECLELIPKIVVLTQEEYDDLDNPDEDTYYFIEEE